MSLENRGGFGPNQSHCSAFSSSNNNFVCDEQDGLVLCCEGSAGSTATQTLGIFKVALETPLQHLCSHLTSTFKKSPEK